MPLDSIYIRELAKELNEMLSDSTADKVQQPGRDTIVLSMRGKKGSHRLLLCGSVGSAGAYITRFPYENPASPPMFCMLLRKHLSGARLVSVSQPMGERILRFDFDTKDELGLREPGALILELIGRSTNIILLNKEGMILDCLRRVDFEKNSARQVMPGLYYRYPSPGDRLNILTEDKGALIELMASAPPAAADREKWILSRFSGLSPLIVRELLKRGGDGENGLVSAFEALLDSLEAGEARPYALKRDGEITDFSFMRISSFDGISEEQEGFSSLLDDFYTRRASQDEFRRRTSSLRKTVKNAYERTERKLSARRSELAATTGREEKKKLAELITANLWQVKGKCSSIKVSDYYEEGCPELEIPLDPLKTPQQNAAKYYKEYNKLKNAEKYLGGLIESNERDLSYLAAVLDELDRADSDAVISDIKDELAKTGFLKKSASGGRKEKTRSFAPFKYTSPDGTEILVGRSNVQNDNLSFSLARRNDIWLHVQKIHGSHVIIRCGDEGASDETIMYAASLAAKHSQADKGSKVPVDYTKVRNLKKPSGALPGMVIYTEYKTVIVTAIKD